MRERLTLLDVAGALGVSRTTVSNAFNRPQLVSGPLRERIIVKSRELGYFGPDPAARAMRRSGIHEVAVIFHHDLAYALSDPPSVEFLRGVTHELDRRQLSLQLIPKMGRRVDLGVAFQTTADAMIVHAEVDPVLADEVRASRKPVVLVDSAVPGAVSVRNEDREGARRAMHHVLAAAPERILALSFPLNESSRASVLKRAAPPPSGYIAGERIAGYALAAREVGYPLERIAWLEVDDREPESAAAVVAAARAGVAPRSRVGVVAMSDRMALAALAVVRDWSDVELVAAVGFDDIEPAARAGLTTVRQDALRKGVVAVQALLDGARPAPLPLELVVRAT